MKVIRGYIHHDGSVGVLARFEVGSDFTSRTPEFKKFADGVLWSLAMYYRQGGSVPESFVSRDVPLDVSWVGAEEWQTVGEAFDAISKEFGEKISVDSMSVVLDGVDRRPLEIQERAARGRH